MAEPLCAVARWLGNALVALGTLVLDLGDRLLERAGDKLPPAPSPFGPVDRSEPYAGLLAYMRPLAAPLPPPVQRRIPPPPPAHKGYTCRCPSCLYQLAQREQQQRARMKLN